MTSEPVKLTRLAGGALVSAAIAVAMLAVAGPAVPDPAKPENLDPHAKVFAESSYPSANVCATCHAQIFKEWSVSSHAYASISPMFHKFEQTINDLSSGTIRDFCVRCHQQVGTQRGELRATPLWDRSQVAREGVTCITCHRVNQEYGKTNGQRTVLPGDLSKPMYGAMRGSKLKEVIAQKDYYRVATDATERGTPIHLSAVRFSQISQPQFCLSCHQVAVHPGIKLEVVWDQYRSSPAAAQGVPCQDCHMGKVPGVNKGYDKGPSAEVNGKPVNPERRHSNHSFFGPGYSIAHPGLFPHNPKAAEIKIKEWLEFNWREGWGEDKFEGQVDKGQIKVQFPKRWADPIDRSDARALIDENLKALEAKKQLRKEVMENGSRLDGPLFDSPPQAGADLNFTYRIRNINPGHNLPSGSLGAQPEIWLNVALIGPNGKTLWETGYVDSNGDMADLHSFDVRAGKLPHDDQLVNLQTKFLTQGVVGTDREMYLPVNFDFDQLPFIRPATVPTTVLNHPPGIRMEQRSIPPLGMRVAKYTVPAKLMTMPGKYQLAARLRSRAEPIYFMKFVKATAEMERAMNEWMIDIHPSTVSFDVK